MPKLTVDETLDPEDVTVRSWLDSDWPWDIDVRVVPSAQSQCHSWYTFTAKSEAGSATAVLDLANMHTGQLYPFCIVRYLEHEFAKLSAR